MNTPKIPDECTGPLSFEQLQQYSRHGVAPELVQQFDVYGKLLTELKNFYGGQVMVLKPERIPEEWRHFEGYRTLKFLTLRVNPSSDFGIAFGLQQAHHSRSQDYNNFVFFCSWIRWEGVEIDSIRYYYENFPLNGGYGFQRGECKTLGEWREQLNFYLGTMFIF